MPRGKKAGSKTPTVDYDAGCLVRSTSTKCQTKKFRTSSSPPISRPESAWGFKTPFQAILKSLAKTCKSGSHSPVALGSRIQGGALKTLGFTNVVAMIRDGYGLEPEEIAVAVEWLKLNPPDEPVPLQSSPKFSRSSRSRGQPRGEFRCFALFSVRLSCRRRSQRLSGRQMHSPAGSGRPTDVLGVGECRLDRWVAKERQLRFPRPAGRTGGELYRYHDQSRS